MVATHEAKIQKDLSKKKVTITRLFEAEPERVWAAWTTRDTLDQWWAPRPWRAETKSLDFREGGTWEYAMVGPAGERHFALLQYEKIVAPYSFEARDSFTDEKGTINTELPQVQWKVTFKPKGKGTEVITTISASSQEPLEKLIEMGFEDGFQMALRNLDEYLERNH
ncbi:MAG TPA: SRPBCC domain-containing protein [Chryseolinea sp.]|nr:SRPBCC domain-containing protein [Chryseolinea sp.]